MGLTLVVLAAGKGSRYGGLKQIDAVGPAGEAVMDYSLYDAVRAGFDRVVFVIRRDIEAQFRAHTGKALGRDIPTDYVFQELTDIPTGFTVPPARVKPWGTAHAIYACRKAVREPFAVLNADDFYGREAFEVIAGHLRGLKVDDRRFCMVGFSMRNTLSEHGPVSRAVCEVDEHGLLRGIVERTHIEKKGNEITVAMEGGGRGTLTGEEAASMNIWGFAPAIFGFLEAEFAAFLKAPSNDTSKAEFFIPTVVGHLIAAGQCRVSVLRTGARWFGITYAPDKQAVTESIRKLIAEGVYPANVRF